MEFLEVLDLKISEIPIVHYEVKNDKPDFYRTLEPIEIYNKSYNSGQIAFLYPDQAQKLLNDKKIVRACPNGSIYDSTMHDCIYVGEKP